MGHKFIALFGGGVQANGMIHIVRGLKGYFFVKTINTGAAGVHKMFYVVMSTTLQNIKKPYNITVYIGFWIFEAITYPSLCGQITDCIKFLILE